MPRRSVIRRLSLPRDNTPRSLIRICDTRDRCPAKLVYLRSDVPANDAIRPFIQEEGDCQLKSNKKSHIVFPLRYFYIFITSPQKLLTGIKHGGRHGRYRAKWLRRDLEDLSKTTELVIPRCTQLKMKRQINLLPAFHELKYMRLINTCKIRY